MMIQSVWKNLTGLQKAAEHLWCDFKWAKNSSPNSNFIHFKTYATEMEMQILSTFVSLLAQFGSAFFSSKEGVPVL